MWCGAQCFIVHMELDGEKTKQRVHARTPAGARKVVRKNYGRNTKIISVRKQSR